jgi:predicted phage-related endonuclease
VSELLVETIPTTSREQWLKVRGRDVTASDIAALFGVHPNKSALQVFLQKTGQKTDHIDTKVLRRGRILEPAVPLAIQEDYPAWRFRKLDVYLRAPALRIGGTPDYARVQDVIDGIAQPEEPVEMKTASVDIYERDWKDGPPLYHQLQVLTQAKLMGVSRGWLAVLVDNFSKDLELHEIRVVESAWQKIVTRVAEFWADVEASKMPEPDYRVDGDVIDDLYPPRPGSSLDLSADNLLPDILDERDKLKAQEKAIRQRIESIDAEIVHKLRGAELGHRPGWHITNKLQSRAGYTVAPTTFSVLRVKRLKIGKEAA